jgi:hypothetical protein
LLAAAIFVWLATDETMSDGDRVGVLVIMGLFCFFLSGIFAYLVADEKESYCADKWFIRVCSFLSFLSVAFFIGAVVSAVIGMIAF